MRSTLLNIVLVVAAGLVISAGPPARPESIAEELQSAMIQESYASFVDARAAKVVKSSGHGRLAELLDRMSQKNRERFEEHSQTLAANGLEDCLAQVIGATVALEIQYGEAAVRSRAENDAEMAAHFDKLAGEARYDRHLLQVELERAFASGVAL